MTLLDNAVTFLAPNEKDIMDEIASDIPHWIPNFLDTKSQNYRNLILEFLELGDKPRKADAL